MSQFYLVSCLCIRSIVNAIEKTLEIVEIVLC